MGDTNNSKFNALTPEVLKENEPVYTEALDYAFSNSDIKNIAITGIYGAGKSTVWNTYKNYRLNKVPDTECKNNLFRNVITVSLGKYIDNEDNSSTETEKDENSKDGNGKTEKDLDNRVERQLINQILSQIKSEDIPLSKYRFKRNHSCLTVLIRIIMILCFLWAILIGLFEESFLIFFKELLGIFSDRGILFIWFGLFFIPLGLFFRTFYRENRFQLHKLNLKGAEANFKDENNDETVLDRDIKELVYLLDNSKSTVVVFEDLDRYDNVEIFTKLRELNLLLNFFIKKNGDGRVVRFVYMLKDGLFFSKNRTKFFDFILPIVPVVDSKTSENQLLELLKGVESAPDKRVLTNISLYVDDMRLLKNIVNEYIVYSKIIPIGKLELESNKLFALITLKNVFPNEFDLLQEDKGFIRTLFDNLERERENIENDLESKRAEINKKIEFIRDKIEDDKFKAMALMIPANVGISERQTEIWSEFLRNWSKKPDYQVNVSEGWSTSCVDYQKFLDRYVLIGAKKKALIEQLPEDGAFAVNKLNSELKKIEQQIRDVSIDSYKKLISKMSLEKRAALFAIENFEITENHYFPLIRFLISEGLIDETYWYYKGKFDVDVSNTLKRNDRIYMKGLLEGKTLDISLEVETPNEIINRLKSTDFFRFNILNKKILEECLKQNAYENCVLAISDSVDMHNNYKKLIEILDVFKPDVTRKYVDIVVKNNIAQLINILKLCHDMNSPTFREVLISILINKEILSADEGLELFRIYIEKNENIVSLIPKAEFKIFTKNISSAGIKFDSLINVNCNKERLIQIERIRAYKLDVQNIIFIVENISGKKIIYGNLLNDIYKSQKLTSSKNYIEENFRDFVSGYIRENKSGVPYTNNEDILVQILKSDISEEEKIEYVEKNETVISDLSILKDDAVTTPIIDCLLVRDKIKFCAENVSVYWDMIEEYNEKFVEYLDRNLNEGNAEEILNNNRQLCNNFINSTIVTDRLFEIVISYANKKVETLDPKLSQEKIYRLIEKDLIQVTEENIKILVDKSYNEEIIALAISDNQDEVIALLLNQDLSDNLIYLLVNSEISDENSIELIGLIKNGALIEKINPDKIAVIESILDGDMSNENVAYIFENFEKFELKERFIKYLNDRRELGGLENRYLTKAFMQYILNLQSVEIDIKLSLIESKINNHASFSDLKEYISYVEDIKEIASVWDKRYPALDNPQKERIGQALIEAGYVKRTHYKKQIRIKAING